MPLLSFHGSIFPFTAQSILFRSLIFPFHNSIFPFTAFLHNLSLVVHNKTTHICLMFQ